MLSSGSVSAVRGSAGLQGLGERAQPAAGLVLPSQILSLGLPRSRPGAGKVSVISSRSSEPTSRLTAQRSPHQSPSPRHGGWWGDCGGPQGERAARAFGRRSAAKTTDMTLGAASPRPPCDQATATGAAAEPQRARSTAARLRAWRVVGVTIWPARAGRSPSTTVSSSSGLVVDAQRERHQEPAAPTTGRAARPSIQSFLCDHHLFGTPNAPTSQL